MDTPPGFPQATLLFLIRGDSPAEILLGFKKTGFGQGKWGGIGGKVEPGEQVQVTFTFCDDNEAVDRVEFSDWSE